MAGEEEEKEEELWGRGGVGRGGASMWRTSNSYLSLPARRSTGEARPQTAVKGQLYTPAIYIYIHRIYTHTYTP
jgi:hypothetical protein